MVARGRDGGHRLVVAGFLVSSVLLVATVLSITHAPVAPPAFPTGGGDGVYDDYFAEFDDSHSRRDDRWGG